MIVAASLALMLTAAAGASADGVGRSAKPARSVKGQLRLPIPKPGTAEIVQFRVRAPKGRKAAKRRAHTPLVRLRGRPPKGVRIVEGVAPSRKHKGQAVVRIVVAAAPSAGNARLAEAQSGSRRAVMAQELGFSPRATTLVGVGNKGVTGASFLNVTINAGRDVHVSGSPICNGLDVAVGDFNGDGTSDIAAVSALDGFSPLGLLRGASDAGCQPGSPLAAGFFGALDSSPAPFKNEAIDLPLDTVADIGVGDFLGNGKQDIAAVGTSGNTGRLVILVGLGDGTFGFPRTFALTAPNPVSVTTGDFDLDGLSDLAIAEAPAAASGGSAGNAVEVFTGSFIKTGRRTTFDHSYALSAAGPLRGIAAGDINGDGRPDLAVVAPGGISTLINTPSGFTPGPALASPTPLWSIAVGRLDTDVFADIAVLEGSPGGAPVMTFLTGSSGNLVPLTNVTLPGASPSAPEPRGIAIGLGNYGGGNPAVTPADTANDVFVATGTGITVLKNPINSGANSLLGGPLNPIPIGMNTFAAGTGPVGVVVGDINGDNVADVLTLNRGSGTISTFIGQNANGGFLAPSQMFIGENPVTLTFGDFNGDGRPDLVVADGSRPPTLDVSLGTGPKAPVHGATTPAPPRGGSQGSGGSTGQPGSGGATPPALQAMINTPSSFPVFVDSSNPVLPVSGGVSGGVPPDTFSWSTNPATSTWSGQNATLFLPSTTSLTNGRTSYTLGLNVQDSQGHMASASGSVIVGCTNTQQVSGDIGSGWQTLFQVCGKFNTNGVQPAKVRFTPNGNSFSGNFNVFEVPASGSCPTITSSMIECGPPKPLSENQVGWFGGVFAMANALATGQSITVREYDGSNNLLGAFTGTL